MRRRFVLVGLFFAVTAVGVCSQFYVEFTTPKFFTPDDYGFGVRQQVGRLVVGSIKPGGPAAGLKVGDEIVSLDGENTRYQTDLITAFQRLQPDSSYSIVVRRDGQLLHLTLSRPDTPALWFYSHRLIYVLAPACFCRRGSCGLWLRPRFCAGFLSRSASTSFSSSRSGRPSCADSRGWHPTFTYRTC